jgi:chemotaxis protein MotA
MLTLLGWGLAGAALVVGCLLKGAALSNLLSSSACVIVLGGTVAATLAQTPASTLRRSIGLTRWLWRSPVAPLEDFIARVSTAARIARRHGVLALQQLVREEPDRFLRHGLQLVLDGLDPVRLRKVLEARMQTIAEEDLEASRVLESMGGYAPTVGILGAVLGLMAVMQQLDDPQRLGPGIAAAFTATLYGIGAANLVFLPLAGKFELLIAQRLRQHRALTDGLVALAAGESAQSIGWRMQSDPT